MRRITNILHRVLAAIKSRLRPVRTKLDKGIEKSLEDVLLIPINRDHYLWIGDCYPEAETFEAVEALYKAKIQVYVVSRQDLLQWKQFYSSENVVRKTSGKEPTNTFIDGLFGEAVQQRASDLFLEINDGVCHLYYRIQGKISASEEKPFLWGQQAIMCLLALAQLNLDKTCKPREGHFRYLYGKDEIFCRLSYINSDNHQSLVIRFLSEKLFPFDWTQLGFPKELEDYCRQTVQHLPSGMILIGGAIGTGKTTTLYSYLKALSEKNYKIISLEDPIEAELENVIQVEINPQTGLYWEKAMQAVLRQDPDVVAIGEIRDVESANAAFQASLAGYLVLATIHANTMDDMLLRAESLQISSQQYHDCIRAQIHQYWYEEDNQRKARFDFRIV